MTYKNLKDLIKKKHLLVYTMSKIMCLMGISNHTIFELQVKQRVYKMLEKKYYYLIKDRKIPNDFEYEKSDKVFGCWMQGYENAPLTIQNGYNSFKKFLPDRDIIFITEDNMSDYVNFPDYIIEKWKKGIISNTHFADLLRAELISKYGGIWCDYTAQCIGDFPEYMTDSPLFVFNNINRGDETIVASSWYLSACKNNYIITAVRDMLLEYWKRENVAYHYLIYHMFFTMACKHFNEEWEKVTFASNINPHIIQWKEATKPFDMKRFNEIKAICPIQKLSNKMFLPEDITGTFYDVLVNKRDEYNI